MLGSLVSGLTLHGHSCSVAWLGLCVWGQVGWKSRQGCEVLVKQEAMEKHKTFLFLEKTTLWTPQPGVPREDEVRWGEWGLSL